MIIGTGIDICDIERIKQAYEKRARFAEKVLTEREQAIFFALSGKRQWEFLAGRFSAKEAFSKALGTGIGKVGFQDIEILNEDNGKPYVQQNVCPNKVHISISHTDSLAIAQVIIEKID